MGSNRVGRPNREPSDISEPNFEIATMCDSCDSYDQTCFVYVT